MKGQRIILIKVAIIWRLRNQRWIMNIIIKLLSFVYKYILNIKMLY